MRRKMIRRWMGKLSKEIGNLWDENKQVLKEILSHSLKFGAMLLAFHIFHSIVSKSSWPDEFKSIVDTMHLFVTYIAVAFFAADFLIRLAKLSFSMAVVMKVILSIGEGVKLLFRVVHRKIYHKRIELENDKESEIENR